MKKAMGSNHEQKSVNFSNSTYTEEESLLTDPKRKLFKNDIESDGDSNRMDYYKPFGERVLNLKSPTGQNNTIKIVDKFEIGVEYPYADTKSKLAIDKGNDGEMIENYKTSQDELEAFQNKNQRSFTTLRETEQSSPSHKLELDKFENTTAAYIQNSKSLSDAKHLKESMTFADSLGSGLNLEKKFIAHHQRISFLPEDDDGIDAERNKNLVDVVQHKSNQRQFLKEMNVKSFDDLEKELKALQEEPIITSESPKVREIEQKEAILGEESLFGKHKSEKEGFLDNENR